MKATKILLGALMVLTVLAACDVIEKDGDWDPMVWTVDNSNEKTDIIHEIPVDGGTLTFTCKNYSSPWLEGAADGLRQYFPPREDNNYHTIVTDWFKVEMVGNKLHVTFEANTTEKERPLRLLVTAGDIFYTFGFKQNAK